MQDSRCCQVEKEQIASIVKLLDRCNNISGMASTFDARHPATYIIETEEYVMPLPKETENLTVIKIKGLSH